MPEMKTVSSHELYFRLLGYLRPYWKVFALAVLGMVCMAATEPVFPAIMKFLLDKGFKTEDARLVWLIPLGIVLLFLLRAVFSFVTNYLMTWLSVRLVMDLRRQMFDKILVLPTQVFHEQSAGKLISRLMYDTENLNQAATNVLVTAIRESLTVVALLGYLLYLDWKLTLITMAIGPMIALVIKGMSLRIRAAGRTNLEARRAMSHTIEESVGAHKVIRVFEGQLQQQERFFRDSEQLRRSIMRETVPSSALTPITHLMASFAIATITYLALAQTTGQAGASAGGFVSFITAMLLLIAPIKQLTGINPIMQQGLSACEAVFQLLDMPEEPDSGARIMLRAKGDIDFMDVCFAYPGVSRATLQGISFHVKAGQTIALVGASGGGKTTVSALLSRFFSPSDGRILIDGTDIQEMTLRSLRQQIALVSQDIVLFNASVASNIAYGAQMHYRREDIIKAAQAANAWEFIQQLPQGLDTLIGEDGATLSGGQRQRLAIARAILKDAPILILDEATSALDTESERQVQAALSSLIKNRTTLIIAHRLSTIEHADLILVLDQGRIVEQGTHNELLAIHEGHYAKLNQMQA